MAPCHCLHEGRNCQPERDAGFRPRPDPQRQLQFWRHRLDEGYGLGDIDRRRLRGHAQGHLHRNRCRHDQGVRHLCVDAWTGHHRHDQGEGAGRRRWRDSVPEVVRRHQRPDFHDDRAGVQRRDGRVDAAHGRWAGAGQYGNGRVRCRGDPNGRCERHGRRCALGLRGADRCAPPGLPRRAGCRRRLRRRGAELADHAGRARQRRHCDLGDRRA